MASTFDFGEFGDAPPVENPGGFGFGAPLGGLPALPAAPLAFGAPAPAFGARAPSFGAPSPGFGAPAPSFGSPAPSFGAPVPGFGAPAPSFDAPAPSFGAPVPGFGAPAPSFNAPDPSFGAPGAPAAPGGFGLPSFGDASPAFAAPMFGLPGFGAAQTDFQAPLLPSQAPMHSAAPGAFRATAFAANIEGTVDTARPYLLQRGQFELKQQISKSGFANVYRGVFKSPGWPVALKELNAPTGFPTFVSDLSQLFDCTDLFLLKIHGITVDPPCSIVTEFVSHGTLAHMLKKYKGQMNGTQRTNIALGIAHGMRALHDRGILHRNLKSANILLDSGLLPRVSDAGIWRLVDAWNEIAPPPARASSQPQWLAPEQLQSGAPSAPGDVYSYAMILYHMLTGDEPWAKVAPAAFVPQVIAGARPPLPDDVIGSGLGDLLVQCWDQDPARRPTFAHICRLFQNRLVGYSGTKAYGLFQLERLIAIADETQVWNGESISQQLADTHVHRRHISKYVNGLLSAAERGDVNDFGKFLTLVPDMNVNVANKEGKTALLLAVEAAKDVMATVICKIDGVDPNVPDKKGVTPLMIAAQQGLVRIVRVLLDMRAINVNAVDGEGNSALHYAAVRGVRDVTRLIIAKGRADLQRRNAAGKRPTELALEKGDEELANILAGLA